MVVIMAIAEFIKFLLLLSARNHDGYLESCLMKLGNDSVKKFHFTDGETEVKRG